MIVMKLFGAANGQPTPFDGQYLKAFDFEAEGGRGLIDMTPDVNQARMFNDMAAALYFYNRQPKIKPFREDGMRNRPLTATNWSFEHFNGECDICHKPGPNPCDDCMPGILNDNSEASNEPSTD